MKRLMIVPLLLLAFVACDKFNPFDVATKDDLPSAVLPTEPEPLPPCIAKIGVPLYLGELTVKLSDVSDDCGSREWELGDGNTSEVEEPIHTYGECGQYVATLKAWADPVAPDSAQVLVEFECAVDL